MDIQKSSEQEIEEPMSANLFQAELEAPAEVEQAGGAKAPAVSPLRESVQRFRRDKRAMISLITIVVIFFLALIFPPIYQHIGTTYQQQVTATFTLPLPPTIYHSPDYQDASRLIQYPSGMHWLGTDDSGQDILARVLKGWQVSLLVAIAVEIQDVLFGTFFGVVSGFFGGIIDATLARFTDLMFAFPGLLFAILVTAIFGEKFAEASILGISFGPYGRLVLASLVLGFIGWPQMARYIRGQTLQLKEQQFIEAARTTGTSGMKIIMRHILPNVAGLIIIVTTLNMATDVVAEGTLSLLGLGAQPPGSSLGLMIFQYSTYLQVFPFEMIWPILGLVILVLAFSFIGDGLRDAFDPRAKD
jgi:peptide/nickel transport system permease protein